MALTKGVKWLTAVFAMFTFCYITRTIYDFMVVPDFEFAHMFSGVTLPIMWDFVPIFLMFAYHYKNSKLIKEE